MNENGVVLENVPCDFCGSTDAHLIFRQKDEYINQFKKYDTEFSVVKCNSCGLIYVNPRPDKESIKFFYPETYHDERLPEKMGWRYKAQERFLPELAPHSKILDVGCAKGDFLAWLSEKHTESQWECYGCDAYSGGVRDGYPVHFTSAELPTCDYASDYFDCVTSWAVFEHVHTPKKYFHTVYRILKKRGVFVFVVPNFNSLMCRVARRDDIPRHLYQFTPKSVAMYLKEAGFTDWKITFDDSIFDGRGRWSLGYRFPLTQLDKLIFSKHWEAALRIGGTMVINVIK